MNKIREVQKLNARELESVTPPSASWHADYKHTAFIYIGGLPFSASEGDIITVFSQFGEPVYLNLVRDKETGKSKGFAFLKYEDQRSCDLAVDNLTGAEVLGRMLRVDHCEYKLKDGERVYDNTRGSEDEEEGSESGKDERPVLPEERELERLLREHDDDDPMKEFMVKEKREDIERAVKRWERHEGRRKEREKRHREHRGDHRRIRSGSGERNGDRRHRQERRRSRSRSPPNGHHSRREERRRRSSTPPVKPRDGGRGSSRRDHTPPRQHRDRSRDREYDRRRRSDRDRRYS